MKGLGAAIAVLLAVTGAGQVAAQADIDGLRVEHANSRNKAITVNASDYPTRSGPTALAFQVAPGQCAGNRTYNDCANGRERAEILDRNRISTGREYWYAASFLIPRGVEAIDPAVTGLMQWQDTRGSGEITLGLSYYRDGIELVQDDPTTQQTDDGDPPRPMVIKYVIPRAQVQGRWHDLRLQAVWSARSDGRIRVWINDRLVHSHDGPNLNRDVAPSFKFGLYRSGLGRLNGDAPRQVIFYDDVRAGDSQAAVTVQ